MADIFRGQGSAIARSFALLPALLFAVLTKHCGDGAALRAADAGC
jgi:hypothetical protein